MSSYTIRGESHLVWWRRVLRSALLNGARLNSAHLRTKVNCGTPLQSAYASYRIYKRRYSIHRRFWWSRHPWSDAQVIFVVAFNVWISTNRGRWRICDWQNTMSKNKNQAPICTDRVQSSAMCSTITWHKPVVGGIMCSRCEAAYTHAQKYTHVWRISEYIYL